MAENYIDLDFRKAIGAYNYLLRKHVSCSCNPIMNGEPIDIESTVMPDLWCKIDIWRISYDDTSNAKAKELIDRYLRAWDKKLRTCPFCGGIPSISYTTECGGHGEFYKTARVICEDCGANTRSVIIDGFYGAETIEQDAIDAWNVRY